MKRNFVIRFDIIIIIVIIIILFIILIIIVMFVIFVSASVRFCAGSTDAEEGGRTWRAGDFYH